MFFRLVVPIIVLILLQILIELASFAKNVRDDFQNSYDLVRCARRDVYERNIRDAVLFLKSREADFQAEPEDFLPIEEEEDCEGKAYAVYRETNDALERLYPNWTFRETLSEPDSR